MTAEAYERRPNMRAYAYESVFALPVRSQIDWVKDDIKVMLCSDAYVPNEGAHMYLRDVVGEVEGLGYAAGGALLTAKTATVSHRTESICWDAADVEWHSSRISAYYAVVYQDTGSPYTSPLICGIDFGGEVHSGRRPWGAGTFTVLWSVDGVISFEVVP